MVGGHGQYNAAAARVNGYRGPGWIMDECGPEAYRPRGIQKVLQVGELGLWPAGLLGSWFLQRGDWCFLFSPRGLCVCLVMVMGNVDVIINAFFSIGSGADFRMP